MFRSGAPRLAMFVLASIATVPLAATGAGAAPANHDIKVLDDRFENPDPKIVEGDSVTWVLESTQTHWIAIDLDNNETIDDQEKAFGQTLSPDGTRSFKWTFADAAPGNPYRYECVRHSNMVGTVLVEEAPPPSSSSTTTTTEPPTTTTTTEPPTTTTTAKPTTTTTRPSTTTTGPTTTQPPATTTTRPSTTTTEPSQSSGSTDSTGRATTTTEPSTTTTGKKARKPRSTETTEAPDSTTTTQDPALLEGEWIPRPDKVLGGQVTTSTTDSGDEAASSGGRDGGGGSGGGGLPVVPLAGAIGAALLGAGGWAWFHRPSRYLSA